MKKMKLLLGTTQFNEGELIELGASVKEGMTNNANFPTLTDAVAAYTAAYDAFLDAIPPPNIRNQVNSSVRDAKKDKFLTEMTALGNLIMGMAKGDAVKLKSTGYRTNSSSNTKKPIAATPEGVKAFITNDPTTLLVNCPTNHDATSYIARVMEAGNEIATWTNFDSASNVLVSGITTGVLLYVQMKLKNSAGESSWSNVVQARLPLPSEPVLKKVNI
jgi:hypothetical protein